MTPFVLSKLEDLGALRVDTIIDVRAPAEFAEDHLPGAVNLPVLDDEERAKVGTIYTQDSPFKARKIGAALVARNTAAHLQNALAAKEGGWQPLVYCWRGGQRSGSFATILDQIGWRVHLLQGGYRSFRKQVVARLYDTPLPHRFVVVDGGTGTAKTALLHHLAQSGAQVLDLEGLAAHRGSLFGKTDDPQPSQKFFESQLAMALTALNPDNVTFVEAESSKIGARIIPPSVWKKMADAGRVRISAPLAARSTYLCRAYRDLTSDRQHLAAVIDQLRPYHASDQISEWQAQAASGAWEALAAGLIAAHYDPRYAKSSARKPAPLQELPLTDLSPETLAKTAAQLVETFSRGTSPPFEETREAIDR